MDEIDDNELLRQYVEARSEGAFAELVRRHLNLVYRSALRQTYGDSHQAEDISQEVFTQLARKAALLVRHPRLAGWLYTTTHFVTSAQLRSERRRLQREKVAQTMYAPPAPSVPNHDLAGAHLVLDELLRGLNPVDREAILLHFFEHQPFAIVGTKLALREDTVRMRVARALEKLRHGLGEQGIVSGSAAIAEMLGNESVNAVPARLLASTARIASTATVAGSISTLGLIQFMSTSKIAVGLAAALGIFAISTGFRYTQNMQSAEASLTRWKERTHSTATRLQDLNEKLAPDAAGQSARKATATPGNPAPALSEKQIAKELALRRLMDRANLENYLMTHSSFLSSLGLSADQIHQLTENNMKIRSNREDLQMAAQLTGVNFATDPIFSEMDHQLQTQMRAGFVAIAGAQAFEALKAQTNLETGQNNPNGPSPMQLSEANYAASQLAGIVFDTPTPLTADQRASLIQAVAANTPHYQPGDLMTLDTINWDGVVAQASATLSPAQISALESLQASAAQTALERQASKAGKGTP